MNTIIRALLGTATVAAMTTTAPFSAPVLAQPYPAKPIRLVVPAASGTPIDIVSRVVADRAAAVLGQPVVVELKPGATGAVGAMEVLKQPADGYTLMITFMPMTVAQSIYANVPFDLRKDFAPIGQTVWSYNVLVVNPSVPARSPKELVELLKAQPGKLSFASGGPGTPAHIAGELFKMQSGTQALHVPYNQFPQAIVDVLGGQVQFMFGAVPPLIPHIAAGKLRALAVTGPIRLAALKDVPTMVEAGFPDFVVRDWQGLVAKAGTSPQVIRQLNAALGHAMRSDEVHALLSKLGADAAAGTADEFGHLIESETARWAKVAKTAGIRVE
jgi:tripartite-type tricarboxylate transporter receptor subunit TctC